MKNIAQFIIALLFAALACLTPAIAQQPSEQLKAARQLAGEFYKAGEYEQALTLGEQALALAIKELGANHEQIAIATYGLGLAADKAGNDAKAAQYYGQTVRVREIVYGKESPGIAEALDLHGLALFRLGRLVEAEAQFSRALKIRKDIIGFDHAYQAGSISNLGSVAVAKGNYVQAVQLFRKAIKLLADQKTDFVYANKVLSKGLKRQRSTFIGLAEAVWSGSKRLGLSGKAAFDESFRASQDAWRTSAAEAIARMTARLGTANTPLGRDVSRLQKLADEIITLNEEDMRELARWSEVQRRSPDYVKARDALQAVTNQRFKKGLSHVKRQRAVSQEMMALIKRCPPGQKKAGCDGSLKRIQELGAQLQKFSQADRQGAQPSLELINRMNAVEKTLPGYDAFQTARQARVGRSTKLGIERRALRQKIIKSYPAFAAMADPKPLAGARAGSFLDQDEALVAMLVGRAKSFVWVITRETMAWGEIAAGERQLATEVTALRQALDPLAARQNPDAAKDFDYRRAYNLYKTVFGPVERHLVGKKHLIFVPNGPLTSLPPQVLITKQPAQHASQKDAVKNAAWLIRSHALSVLPSVQSLESLRRLQRTAGNRKPFLGIGDPVLKGADGETDKSRGAGSSKIANKSQRFYTRGLANVRAVSAMTPLPDTADELRAIARVLGAPTSDVLLQGAATEPQIKALSLADYRIVHFATHGLVAGELSGLAEPALVLTPPAKATLDDDGLLTASEIATLSLNADWVVLSACNTAAGEEVGAEALSGLARAFFFSGARTLLVSHWAVFSDAAVKLTTRTFSKINAEPGIGRAEAFRQSMLKLIDEGRPPGYWAPFVIVGEGGAGR